MSTYPHRKGTKMSSGEASDAQGQEVMARLENAIIGYDQDAARAAATAALEAGHEPMTVIDTVIVNVAETVHQKFESGEYFLPQLVLAADAMTAASEVLEAALPKESLRIKKVVVIGTVEGDIHTLGKTIVTMMLRAGGFDVHDLGVDVKSSTFVDRARELNADIIALSSLLTTTLPYQREVIETLVAMGLRDRFKVIVGGGPATAEWATEIGADGYGKDAATGLAEAKRVVGL